MIYIDFISIALRNIFLYNKYNKTKTLIYHSVKVVVNVENDFQGQVQGHL